MEWSWTSVVRSMYHGIIWWTGTGQRSISTDKTCDVIRRVIKGGGVDEVLLLAHILSTNMNDGEKTTCKRPHPNSSLILK